MAEKKMEIYRSGVRMSIDPSELSTYQKQGWQKFIFENWLAAEEKRLGRKLEIENPEQKKKKDK